MIVFNEVWYLVQIEYTSACERLIYSRSGNPVRTGVYTAVRFQMRRLSVDLATSRVGAAVLLLGALPPAPRPLAPSRSALLLHAGLSICGAFYRALRTHSAALVQVQQDHRHHEQRAALLALHLRLHIRSVRGGQRARRDDIHIRHDRLEVSYKTRQVKRRGVTRCPGEKENPPSLKNNNNTMFLFLLRSSCATSCESAPGNVMFPTRVRQYLCSLEVFPCTSKTNKQRVCPISSRVSDKSQKSCRCLAGPLHNCVKTCVSARAAAAAVFFAVLFLKRNNFAESQGVIATPRSDWSLPERCLTRYQESPSKRRKCGSRCPIASSLGVASGLGLACTRKP